MYTMNRSVFVTVHKGVKFGVL